MSEQYTIYEYLNRDDILNDGIVQCIKQLYDDSYPKIGKDNYDTIINKIKKLDEHNNIKNRKTPIELTGNDGKQYMYPHDFFYCPMSYQVNVIDNYTEAYAVDRKWEPYIDTLIDYLENEDGTSCTETYETDENGVSKRTYKNVPKLYDALKYILHQHGIDDDDLLNEINDKIFEHIDLCKHFYKFGLPEENYFRAGIVFRSPNSNRENVVDAWKQVFDENITIPPDTTWVDEFEENEGVDVDLEKNEFL